MVPIMAEATAMAVAVGMDITTMKIKEVSGNDSSEYETHVPAYSRLAEESLIKNQAGAGFDHRKIKLIK
jgi:hypothetical protein